MKIKFLGTGAADWAPDRRDHGDEYRGNASALINDFILIDPGPTVPAALKKFIILGSAGIPVAAPIAAFVVESANDIPAL